MKRKNIDAVMELLKAEYFDSDVVGGEMILTSTVSTEYTEEEALKGINKFLKWEGSPAKVKIKKSEDGKQWEVVEIN